MTPRDIAGERKKPTPQKTKKHKIPCIGSDLNLSVCVCMYSIVGRHAELSEKDGKYTLEPLEQNMRLMLNGKAVVEKMAIKHNDR